MITLLLHFGFLAGGVLFVLEIPIYRKTMINWQIPATIWLLGWLVITPFIIYILSKYYRKSGLGFRAICYAGSWSMIIVYCFMAINYYFPDVNLQDYQFPILKKSTSKGRTATSPTIPSVTINYFGKQKEVELNYRHTDLFNRADSIVLTVKKGRLGYDVIHSYTLKAK